MMTFEQFIAKYFAKDADARLWILSYMTYCHSIDDIIDQEQFVDAEFVLKTFGLAPMIFGNYFYLQNLSRLYPLVKLAHDSYRDSVVMEKSNETWKQHYSDVLRQNAINVVLECIEILEGKEVRDEASMTAWEIAYRTHHTEEGVRI